MRAAFRLAAADWARRLAEQARRQATAEAAQFRRYLSARPHDGDLAVLADLDGRLASFLGSLAAWVPDAGRPAAPEAEPRAAPPAGPGAACAICGRLEQAQTGYLIRRQYLLATSEADQVAGIAGARDCPACAVLAATERGRPPGNWRRRHRPRSRRSSACGTWPWSSKPARILDATGETRQQAIIGLDRPGFSWSLHQILGGSENYSDPETRFTSLRIGRPFGAVWLIGSGRDTFGAWLMLSAPATVTC